MSRSPMGMKEGWRVQNELVRNVKIFSLNDLRKGRIEERFKDE